MTQTEAELDDSLMQVAGKFSRKAEPATPTPSTPAPASSTPAAKAPVVAPAPQPAAAPVPAGSKPTIPEGDDAGGEAADLDDVAITTLIPQEAQSKRVLKACQRAVSKWAPPETLSSREATKYRHVAVAVRAAEVVAGVSKLQLGLLLIEAKERLKRGQWCDYVETACGIPRRRASACMAVAKMFKDHRVVLALGYEFCIEIAESSPPEDVIGRIAGAPDRAAAELVFQEWQQDVRIADAFAGLAIEKPAEVFGRDLACDLAAPNIVRELRERACEIKEPGAVRDLLNTYRQKLAEGKDGHTAFIEAQGQEQAHAAPKKLRLKNLFARIDALSRYKDAEVDDRAAELAREIEEKLLELEQLVQHPA